MIPMESGGVAGDRERSRARVNIAAQAAGRGHLGQDGGAIIPYSQQIQKTRRFWRRN